MGDRDARSEDRQLLLDALLAAREHLVITYCGHDERSNLPRPPAVPVGELLDVVDHTVRTAEGRARDAIRVEHPLQPFDPRNFVPGKLIPARPWSFDELNLEGARAALASGRAASRRSWSTRWSSEVRDDRPRPARSLPARSRQGLPARTARGVALGPDPGLRGRHPHRARIRWPNCGIAERILAGPTRRGQLGCLREGRDRTGGAAARVAGRPGARRNAARHRRARPGRPAPLGQLPPPRSRSTSTSRTSPPSSGRWPGCAATSSPGDLPTDAAGAAAERVAAPPGAERHVPGGALRDADDRPDAQGRTARRVGGHRRTARPGSAGSSRRGASPSGGSRRALRARHVRAAAALLQDLRRLRGRTGSRHGSWRGRQSARKELGVDNDRDNENRDKSTFVLGEELSFADDGRAARAVRSRVRGSSSTHPSLIVSAFAPGRLWDGLLAFESLRLR